MTPVEEHEPTLSQEAATLHGPIPQRRSRLWATLRAVLRARVTAGLILVLPIWITYLLVKFIFDLMRDTSLWVVVSYLESHWGAPILERWGVTQEQVAQQGLAALDPKWQWIIAIVAVFLTIAFLYIVGVLSANFFGRRIVGAVESLLDRVPLVKTVYRACKQILETFAADKEQGFQRVVLVPFPTNDVRSVGFITGISRDSRTGEELATVFLATTPNPTTGYVFVLRRSDLIELDWSIEEAVKMVISGGVVTPPSMPFAGTPPAAVPPRPQPSSISRS